MKGKIKNRLDIIDIWHGYDDFEQSLCEFRDKKTGEKIKLLLQTHGDWPFEHSNVLTFYNSGCNDEGELKKMENILKEVLKKEDIEMEKLCDVLVMAFDLTVEKLEGEDDE